MFKAVAKAVDAKVTTRKKPSRVIAQIEEGLKSVRDIRSGKETPKTLEEIIYGN